MITKEMLKEAIQAGLSMDTLQDMFNAALAEAEQERENCEALMDGLMAYTGKSHPVWGIVDPWDFFEDLEDFISKSISKIMNDNQDLVSPGEPDCNCENECSCGNKNVAKMIVKDKNGVVERELSMDEINEVIDTWLSKMI